MLDIRFVREHPDEVKEHIKKKVQDAKLTPCAPTATSFPSRLAC